MRKKCVALFLALVMLGSSVAAQAVSGLPQSETRPIATAKPTAKATPKPTAKVVAKSTRPTNLGKAYQLKDGVTGFVYSLGYSPSSFVYAENKIHKIDSGYAWQTEAGVYVSKDLKNWDMTMSWGSGGVYQGDSMIIARAVNLESGKEVVKTYYSEDAKTWYPFSAVKRKYYWEGITVNNKLFVNGSEGLSLLEIKNGQLVETRIPMPAKEGFDESKIFHNGGYYVLLGKNELYSCKGIPQKTSDWKKIKLQLDGKVLKETVEYCHTMENSKDLLVTLKTKNSYSNYVLNSKNMLNKASDEDMSAYSEYFNKAYYSMSSKNVKIIERAQAGKGSLKWETVFDARSYEKKIGSGRSLYLQDIFFDKSSIIVVASVKNDTEIGIGYRFYRSDDNGSTWQQYEPSIRYKGKDIKDIESGKPAYPVIELNDDADFALGILPSVKSIEIYDAFGKILPNADPGILVWEWKYDVNYAGYGVDDTELIYDAKDKRLKFKNEADRKELVRLIKDGTKNVGIWAFAFVPGGNGTVYLEIMDWA